MRITSLHNERVKAAVKLRDRNGRDEQQRIIIDGVREIGRALGAGVEVVELYFNEQFAASADGARLIDQAEHGGSALFECSSPVLEKVVYGDRHDGMVAVAKSPNFSLGGLARAPLAAVAGSKSLFAVVEGVEKPGNLGAIMRSADAAGVSGVIVADGGTDLFNPNAIRASVGSIFTVPVAAASTAQTLGWLRKQNVQIVAAQVDATVDYTAIDFTKSTAIALGSESHGLSPAWRAADILPIRLPMCGQVDSLNVSVTAAVLFYESLRQRKFSGERDA